MQDCVVTGDCTLGDCSHVARCVFMDGTSAHSCGGLTGPTALATTCFGNALVNVSPGPELRGRDVQCTAHLSLEAAARVAVDRSPDGVAAFNRAAAEFFNAVRSAHTIVARSRLLFAAGVHASCLLGARVESGGIVAESTLLDGAQCVMHGLVERSLLQEGARVDSMGIVRGSLMCGGGHVELHGKLLSSILGPQGHVAEGEATSCLVGPQVGLHHQSLLIACLWPSGRGNVGYGANVGSNHTSRAPDQSLWPGEGVFFGLGTSSKFPLNLSEAPYSVVATGVVWGPGRLGFPWSLVTQDGNGVRVAPGWGVAHNAYALERAELKAAERGVPGYGAWLSCVRPGH